MKRHREKPDGSSLNTDPRHASGHKCPRCAAPPGDCCSTPSGDNTYTHAGRVRLAMRAKTETSDRDNPHHERFLAFKEEMFGENMTDETKRLLEEAVKAMEGFGPPTFVLTDSKYHIT